MIKLLLTTVLLTCLASCEISINKDHVAEGTKLMAQGDYYHADLEFDDALFMDESNLDALRGSCYCALNMGQPDKALQAASKYIELEPNSSLGYNDRGSIYLVKKEYKKALADFTSALEKGTHDPAVSYFNKAEALRELSRFEEAIQCYNRVLATDKKDARAHYKKGLAFSKIGKVDSACISYKIAKELGDVDAAKESRSICQ